MLRTLAFIAVCIPALAGSALAQDANTVIAAAQKALGAAQAITYSGSARDVAFQQCGANAGEFCRTGAVRGLRYSKVVSYGNGTDVREWSRCPGRWSSASDEGAPCADLGCEWTELRGRRRDGRPVTGRHDDHARHHIARGVVAPNATRDWTTAE